MNDMHIQQIFKNYIDNFELINNSEHKEYYKWQVAKEFRFLMDEAMESEGKEFVTRLKKVRKCTYNLIDAYTQPFQGLINFAEREPETVKKMFEDLFASADKEIEKKQSAISEFLRKSHELRDRYEEGSYLYKNDMHSVTSYLFLYAPEQNYIFKASHARAFADCIEFYDDWGSGDSVKLNVYYRMCNQVADAIKASPAMMKTDASRFENGWGIDPKTFIADTEKHLLVFDVMYCCSTYELFSGITFKHLNVKEKQLLLEKKEKAIRYAKELREAQGEFEKLQEALNYLSNVFKTGEIVQHKKYGKGTVVTANMQEDRLEVEFTAGEKKKLGMVLSVVNNIVSSLHEDYAAQMQIYRDILKKKSTIEKTVSYAEKNFEEYANWLN